VWNEQDLELGHPSVMDTPTLIEWIQRQLETPEETKDRHYLEQLEHLKTHIPGVISACCIVASPIQANNIVASNVLTPNEYRDSQELHTS